MGHRGRSTRPHDTERVIFLILLDGKSLTTCCGGIRQSRSRQQMRNIWQNKANLNST